MLLNITPKHVHHDIFSSVAYLAGVFVAVMTKKKAKKAEVSNGDAEPAPVVQTNGGASGTSSSSAKTKKLANGHASESPYPPSSLLICRNK